MFSALASRHHRLKIGPHDAIDAEALGDAVELVQVELALRQASPEGFQGDVQADRIAEPETVRDCAREAVDAHQVALEAMLLDSFTEHRRRYSHRPQRRMAQPRHARAARHGDLS